MALNAFSFRIRGRITRLMHLYRLFVEKPDTGLHPAQLARAARMSILDVDERLRRTPELFVKIPKRKDGITRYRLTSAVAGLSEEEVKAMLTSLARRETILLNTGMAMILLLFSIMLILIGPTL